MSTTTEIIKRNTDRIEDIMSQIKHAIDGMKAEKGAEGTAKARLQEAYYRIGEGQEKLKNALFLLEE